MWWRLSVHFLFIIVSLGLGIAGLVRGSIILESSGMCGLFACALLGLGIAKMCYVFHDFIVRFIGEPITVDKLEEAAYYSICGIMDIANLDGFCQVVLVQHPTKGRKAVRLQRRLPEGAYGFHVVPHTDHLNREMEGMVDLVLSCSNCLGHPRITINTYPGANQPEDEDPTDNIIPPEDE